jgi:hypothetical protein
MAYNPFNIFRRNQKAIFAVLTVFIMIMFTLSFGKGDFFDMLSSWLGSTKGDVLCKIDGRKITNTDLEGGQRGLQFKRLMANRFMFFAAQETYVALLAYADQQRDKLSPQGREMSDAVKNAARAMDQLNDPQLKMFVQANPQFAQQLTQQYISQIQYAEYLVDLTTESPNAKEDDKNTARAFKSAFALRRTLQNSTNGHYFVNAPNRNERDKIEFLLWEKKADQLGIRFSRDDVKRLIQKECYEFLRPEADVRVQKRLAEAQPGYTIDACLDALAAEFRVRAAQAAVLGYNVRFRGDVDGAPAFSTPYEAYEYYRDQCSPSTYEIISVPATAFLDKVVGGPSETEINELYKKYANDEPTPRSETPGFKTPRKVAVAYIGITGEEPYYKKLAEEQIKVGEVMAKASGALTVPVPGVGPAWAIGVAGPLSLKEPAVDAAYNTKVKEFEEQRRQNYTRSTLDPRPAFSSLELLDPILPTNVVRPSVVAATVGALVGQTNAFGNRAAPTLAMTAPLAFEIRERVSIGLPLALGAMPNPALLQTMIGGAVVASKKEPKPLPIEAYRPELLKGAIDARAKVLAFGEKPSGFSPRPDEIREKGDVERFKEELKKLSENGKPKDKDKTAVEKYIQEFIKTRGLTVVGASTEPRDEWTLEDDPKLAPLVQAQEEALRSARGAHGGEFRPFGKSFFWTEGFDFMTRSVRRSPAAGLYLAETYPPQEREARPGKPRYIVWRTEEKASERQDTNRARPAVIAAWKRLKARELAKQHAEDIANKIRASGKTSGATLEAPLFELYTNLCRDLRDPKVLERTRKFTVPGVAPLAVESVGLRPFVLTESNDVPYPTPDMTTALIDNRDKPIGTALVLPDAPKDTFYVAVLTNRNVKSPGDFRTDVYQSTGFAPPPAREILGRYRVEVVKRTRESVVELLKKEFRYEETEEQKKKLDDNAKSGSNRFDE